MHEPTKEPLSNAAAQKWRFGLIPEGSCTTVASRHVLATSTDYGKEGKLTLRLTAVLLHLCILLMV